MHNRTHQKLAFWFPAVGEDVRPGLSSALVYVNLLRQRILVWVFVSLHLAIICQYYLRTGRIGSPYIGTGHLGTLLCCIVFLIVVGRPASPAGINRRHRFCEGVVFLLIFLGAGLQIGLLAPKQLSIVPYVLTIFLSAAFFCLSGPKMFLLFGLAWSVWVAMVWHLSTNLHSPTEMIITGTFSTFLAVIIARNTFLSSVKIFFSLRTIEGHRQQQKELKNLNEISARLAHEIRNPLMAAGGFARRLSSSLSPEDPNREKAEVILKELGRLENILHTILNYLKPLELDKSLIDPNQLVKKALHKMDGEIKRRNVCLDFQLEVGLSKIPADSALMEQVVEVLLKNAVNQMPAEATLSVATLQENNMFKLAMWYPALHMSGDDVEDFFYPFTTSHIAQDTAHDTVDIPRSKIVVEKHGGEVNVRLKDSSEIFIQVSLPLTPISLVAD